mgnify:CR=1 FL=1
MTEEHQHRHHHTSSGHHHHIDDAERFKQRQLRAVRRKKVFSKILFWTLSGVAVVMLFTVYWLYTH